MESLVVYWDGKLLPDLSGKKKDCLPVIMFFEGMAQLLGVPKLESASGHNQANTVFESLSEWYVANKVQDLCCDTTASNTGHLNGACFLLEQLMEHDLLYLPYRHQIFELVLSVLDLKLSLATSGPDVPIFKRFQENWPKIDAKKFDFGIIDPSVKAAIEHIKEETVLFCIKSLKKKQCRENYTELLELTLIFLGKTPPCGILFQYPGAFHHARFMSKAINS